MLDGNFLISIWNRVSGSDTLLAVILSSAIALVVALTKYVFRRQPKVVWAITYDKVFLPPREDGSQGVLRVRQILLKNIGTKMAEKIEVTFNWPPQHFEHYPHLPIRKELRDDQRFFVEIPTLNAKEELSFSIAADKHELPDIIYVRCAGSVVKRIEIEINRKLPLYMKISLFITLGIGFISLFSLFIGFAGWLIFGRPPALL